MPYVVSRLFLIRKLTSFFQASIANAPLVFTSFVVGHVFESPQALFRVVSTHYSSQLTKQVFGILGSLAILGAPADFISNVGKCIYLNRVFLYRGSVLTAFRVSR